MNVIRLLERREDDLNFQAEEEDLLYVKVIGDDLNNLVPKNGDYFAIYIIWMGDCEMNQPISMLQLDDSTDLVRLSADEAIEQSTDLWNIREQTNETPLTSRKIGSILKINIWRSQSKIHLSWEDSFRKNVKSRIRVFEKTVRDTFLVIPGRMNLIALCEDSYMKYLAAGTIERKMTCAIFFEEIDVPFLINSCGHCVCSRCYYVSNDKICPICRQDENEQPTLVNFRDGPCPIDLCSTNNISNGVVLQPCGCHIPCSYLHSQVVQDDDQTEILKTFSRCPYNACRQKIQKLLKIFA